MDICVSSNFERYLFHLMDDDPEKLSNLMKAFEATSRLTLSGRTLARAQEDFKSAKCDTAQTLDVIKTCVRAKRAQGAQRAQRARRAC
jgi:threonine synthase